VLVWGPRELAQLAADRDDLSPAARADAEASARTALVQAVAGAAAAGGLIFTARQVRERRTQQSADLFLKAVEKLSASDSSSRLYAIHSLERVAALSPADRSAAERILAEVVRAGPSHPSAKPPANIRSQKTMAPALADRVYQAALEVLGSRRLRPRREPLGLEGIVFEQPHIDGLSFDRCCLRNARFYDGHINGTSFQRSSLHNATVSGEIAGADFRNADLRGTEITSIQATDTTHVEGTNEAHATDRFIDGIRFEGAFYNRSTVERMRPAGLARRLKEEGILVEHEEPLVPGCR